MEWAVGADCSGLWSPLEDDLGVLSGPVLECFCLSFLHGDLLAVRVFGRFLVDGMFLEFLLLALGSVFAISASAG